MLRLMGEAGIDDADVLDIGGGVGAIQQALLAAGAARAISVDASSAYTRAAERYAQEEGFADQVVRIHGDFTVVAPRLETTDIVTLDRVLCCFDDMPALVSASASKAARFWGAVYPRDFWIARFGMALMRGVMSLLRNPMRFYVHRTEDVDVVLRQQGLEQRLRQYSGVWQVVIYERV